MAESVLGDILGTLMQGLMAVAGAISDASDKFEAMSQSPVEVWVEPEGALMVQLPVTPDSYKVTQQSGNSTVNLLSAGDTTLIGKPKKAEISWSGHLPSQYRHYCAVSEDNFMPPYFYVKILNDMAKNGTPCQLTITGTDVNTSATVTEFTHQEDDASGDVSYDVKFEVYPKVSRKAVQTTPTPKNSSGTTVTSYTVKKGDTVTSISRQLYGTTKYAKKIYNVNKTTIEAAWNKHKNKELADFKKWKRKHPHDNSRIYAVATTSEKGKFLTKGTKLTLKGVK